MRALASRPNCFAVLDSRVGLSLPFRCATFFCLPHKPNHNLMNNTRDSIIVFFAWRLASLSEKQVKQDQRLVEDTTSANRQSELEKDFSAFFDNERLDACDKMQSIYQNKEEDYLYVYYPRLACIIFEVRRLSLWTRKMNKRKWGDRGEGSHFRP